MCTRPACQPCNCHSHECETCTKAPNRKLDEAADDDEFRSKVGDDLVQPFVWIVTDSRGRFIGCFASEGGALDAVPGLTIAYSYLPKRLWNIFRATIH
jgi:hypothetical protein